MTVDVTEREENGVLVLRVDGRLDATSSPLVEKRVSSFIESGHKQLVLNFEHVEFLSSAGLRTLLSLTKKLKSLHGKMVIAAVNDEVMEVIRMAGFDHILEISAKESEALRQFQEPAR